MVRVRVRVRARKKKIKQISKEETKGREEANQEKDNDREQIDGCQRGGGCNWREMGMREKGGKYIQNNKLLNWP